MPRYYSRHELTRYANLDAEAADLEVLINKYLLVLGEWMQRDKAISGRDIIDAVKPR